MAEHLLTSRNSFGYFLKIFSHKICFLTNIFHNGRALVIEQKFFQIFPKKYFPGKIFSYTNIFHNGRALVIEQNFFRIFSISVQLEDILD